MVFGFQEPALVQVSDYGQLPDGTAYLIMEYLEGIDLSDLLHKRGPVPAHEACEYVLQACETLSCAVCGGR